MTKTLREIKNRWTGAVIYSGEVNSLVELAVANKADLSSARLRSADLSSADLSSANLRSADLRGADLRSADLRDANLRDADLGGANLSDADLSNANLSGADLSGANLSGTNLSGGLSGVPAISDIHKAVYAAATATDESLDMGDWHTCETTHCRAGWVIALAGPAGAAMEWCLGTTAAAALIYMRSDPKLDRVPNFYVNDEDALADMKRLAEV